MHENISSQPDNMATILVVLPLGLMKSYNYVANSHV
jgi:hypothetical protein